MAQILSAPEVLLASLGKASAGHWLEVWVSLDAFLVLSGAVITSFVGVTGLVKRLAGDRCVGVGLCHVGWVCTASHHSLRVVWCLD
jgi:hypothetical protein